MNFFAARNVRALVLAGAFLVQSVVIPSVAYAAPDDLVLNISNSQFNPVAAGGLADYSVRIDNPSPIATAHANITLTVPANTVFEGAIGFESCTPDGSVFIEGPAEIVCVIPALASDGVINAKVNFRHMAEGVSGLSVAIEDGTSSSRPTTVQRGADLAVELSATPGVIQAGDNVEFTAVVTNNGPYGSDTGIMEVTIPTGMSPGFDLDPGCTVSGNIISCVVGMLEDGESKVFTFKSQATATDASTVTMSAAVNSTLPRDPISHNNNTKADVRIEIGTNVSLSKVRSPLGLILLGQPVAFEITPTVVGVEPKIAHVTDTVPDNYEIDATSLSYGAGWTCGIVGQTLECDFDGAVSGADYSSPIKFDTTAIKAAKGVVNSATIESPNENDSDEARANNTVTDGEADIALPILDLRAYKSGPPRGLVTVGNSYSFTLKAQNQGNIDFSLPVEITDYVPAGLIIREITAPADWVCPAAPAEGFVGPTAITCTTDKYISSPLKPGDFLDSISILAEVTAAGDIVNGMLVGYEDYEDKDATPGNNTDTTAVGSADDEHWADISVNKAIISPLPVAPSIIPEVISGDSITYRIELVNDGPADALEVKMQDLLSPIVNPGGGPVVTEPAFSVSAGDTDMTCRIDPGTGSYSRNLVCEVSELPECVAGTDCPFVTVTVNPGESGLQKNEVVAYSYKTPDFNLENNSSVVEYTVASRTDVTVSKASPSALVGAAVGQEMRYVITASVPRSGLSAAANVSIVDTLPAGLRFISATPSVGTCGRVPGFETITAPGNDIIECNLETIANGAQQTVSIVVVPTLPLVDTDIVNSVVVSTDTPETNDENNEADVTVHIFPPVLDLIVSKEDTIDPLLIESNTIYQVKVINSGPSDATHVILKDILPVTGMANPTVTAPDGWTCLPADIVADSAGGSITCNIDYFPSGSVANIEFDMKGIARGRHLNNVSVTSDESKAGYETTMANNVTSEDTTVRVRSDLMVTKEPVSKDDLTTPVTTIDLREEFAWLLDVRSRSGAGLGLDVSEDVTLEDILPAGMVLTRVPVIQPWTGSDNSIPPLNRDATCSSVAGDSVVSCSLGDIPAGKNTTVVVYVKLTTVGTPGVPIENTVTVKTSSFDQDTTNNTATGVVAPPHVATISGSIWRDFDGNTFRDLSHDSGVASTTVSLVGTSLLDGATITATTTTLADGSFVFTDIPAGTYTVSYVTVPANHKVGGSRFGDTGTFTTGSKQISGIVAEIDENAAGNEFTVIPHPKIGLTKTASSPVFNADGSYAITYTLGVTNSSLEPLENINLLDNLEGVTGNFGTYTASTAPAFGEYTVSGVSYVGDLVNGFMAPYTGVAGADHLIFDGKLAAGKKVTITLVLRVNPSVPRMKPLGHLNVATVDGTGEWSGQDKTKNTDLTKTASVNVTPNFSPSISIEKSTTFDSASFNVGDTVTYTFAITNTGKTPLVDVVLSDPMPNLIGLDVTPITLLNVGQLVTRTATYILTQEDVDNGSVANTAGVVGIWGTDGVNLQDVSDTSTVTISGLSKPGLSLVKSISDDTISDPTLVGDKITYSFLVTNTGNTTLRDVVIVDDMLGELAEFELNTLAPGSPPVTVTVEYLVTLEDINNGRVDNTAFAEGKTGPGAGTPVKSPVDSETIPLNQNPLMDVVKTYVSGAKDRPEPGDIITWDVVVYNTGNVVLNDIVLNDPIAGAVIVPVSHASVAPGNNVVFTVTAPLTQEHINAGEVVNQGTVDYEVPGKDGGTPGTPVESGNEPGDPDEPTVVPLKRVPSIALIKKVTSNADDVPAIGAEVTYSFTIKNTGNVTLYDISLEELSLLDAVITNVTGWTGPLAPGEVNSTAFTASYILTQPDIDRGQVENSAEVTGVDRAPSGSVDVTDISGTDFDNNTPTVYPPEREPGISLVKSVSSVTRDGVLVSGAVPNDMVLAGDVINYSFSIKNIGNVTLKDIQLTDILPDANIVNETGWSGPLAPTEVNSTAFIATYVIKQSDIDAGKVENHATVSGVGPLPGDTRVYASSGTDIDNTDPTISVILANPELEIVKTADVTAVNSPARAGDEIVYTFTVTNIGNVTLNDVTVTDPLPGLVFYPIDAVIGTLIPDQVGEVTATYSLTQDDIEAGEVVNTAAADGTYYNPSTGVDEPVDAPSNTVKVPLEQSGQIRLVKTEVSDLQDPTQVGEVIEYYFTVYNEGNLTLTNVNLVDPLEGLDIDEVLIAELAPYSNQKFGPYPYSIVQADIDRGEVVNQATVTAEYVGGTTTDLSGPDIDTDEELIVPVTQPAPSLTIEKTSEFIGSSEYYALVGDTVQFTFVITNTGNVTLENVSPRETVFTFGSVAPEGTLSAFSPLSVTLERDESATFTATYELTQGDLNAAANVEDGVSNTAEAVGTFEDEDDIVSEPDTAELTLLPQPPSDVTITKTTERPVIHKGETVPYTITVVNNSLADAGMISVVDRMPAGFMFVEGSASVNGVLADPVLSANQLTFENVRLPALGRVEIVLTLRALPATPPGRYTNIALAFDELGNQLDDEARAVVEIVADAVFDCTDIIGTVFNDLNGNGYQDQDEPGIPGVRVTTTTGTLISTDAYGRYSVPCAAIPDSVIGSNFVLKIDDRTLPTGFSMTTDNPAMKRLTAGKMVEINFGASIGRQVKLNLDDKAFIAGSTTVTATVASGLVELIDVLKQEPSTLFIKYETKQSAGSRERLQNVRSMIEQKWREIGSPYKLVIDTTVIEW